MMTNKDYIRAAKLVSKEFEHNNTVIKERVIKVFVEFFQPDNPKFNEKTFRSACNSLSD